MSIETRFEALVIKSAETKVGRYGKYLFVQCRNPKNNEMFGVIGAENKSDLLMLEPGQLITVWKDGNKYRLFNTSTTPRNVNGNGFKKLDTVLQPQKQEYKTGAYGYVLESELDNDNDEDDDLGLPHPLTPAQKKELKRLIDERAKLVRYCIDTMRKELIEMGSYEFHENSIRSLGVSLFIRRCSNEGYSLRKNPSSNSTDDLRNVVTAKRA